MPDAFLRNVIAIRNRQQGIADGLAADADRRALELDRADEERMRWLNTHNPKQRCLGCGGGLNERANGQVPDYCALCTKRFGRRKAVPLQVALTHASATRKTGKLCACGRAVRRRQGMDVAPDRCFRCDKGPIRTQRCGCGRRTKGRPQCFVCRQNHPRLGILAAPVSAPPAIAPPAEVATPPKVNASSGTPPSSKRRANAPRSASGEGPANPRFSSPSVEAGLRRFFLDGFWRGFLGLGR